MSCASKEEYSFRPEIPSVFLRRESGSIQWRKPSGVEGLSSSENWAHDPAMDSQDEYRRNAEEAQRQAGRAVSEIDRAAWLQLAQGWLAC
jgi:hypothetical protein